MTKVWLNGELVEQEQANVSVFDHGLLYGDGCFEGLRAYNGRVFKLGSHLRRLYESAEKIRLTPAYSPEQVGAAVRETLAANGQRDAYIRLIFSRGPGTLGLHPFRCPRPNTIIITADIQLYPPELYENGMKVVVAKRPRIPIACLDPAIKSLNYLNNILAKIEAIDADVLEAIMLNLDEAGDWYSYGVWDVQYDNGRAVPFVPGTDNPADYDIFDTRQSWQEPRQWLLDQNNNVHRVVGVDRDPDNDNFLRVELTRPLQPVMTGWYSNDTFTFQGLPVPWNNVSPPSDSPDFYLADPSGSSRCSSGRRRWNDSSRLPSRSG
jgi:hypothetical protein